MTAAVEKLWTTANEALILVGPFDELHILGCFIHFLAFFIVTLPSSVNKTHFLQISYEIPHFLGHSLFFCMTLSILTASSKTVRAGTLTALNETRKGKFLSPPLDLIILNQILAVKAFPLFC